MPWHPLRRGLGLVPWFKVLRESPALQPGILGERLLRAVDRVHEGFAVYLQRGRWAVLQAFGLTVAFFWARFSVAFFILKGLGLSTTPHTYVAPGPPSPRSSRCRPCSTSSPPGRLGIAEAGSNTLMSPWVPTDYELPYLVLWRILALFLCMFVGGAYVFRYLGTDARAPRPRGRGGAAGPRGRLMPYGPAIPSSESSGVQTARLTLGFARSIGGAAV
ncbi:MAG: hypothetical protein IPN17_38155 [Deltaproteobacteria bacterium]|nr:hypothetical protein [Deltaproteobacteria bacterium]